MAIYNNNLGKFFSPSASYSGLVLIAAGIFTMFYSLTSLILVLPGAFLAFTYDGTILDTDNKRVKSYTTLFGIIRTGKWVNTDKFTRFSIIKATKNFTSYSRANVQFDMGISDIRLILTNKNGSEKVIINKFGKFEEAQEEMEKLSRVLFPDMPKSEI